MNRKEFDKRHQTSSQDEVPEKVSLLKKFNDFKNRFYLDSHHTVERRSVLVIIASFLLAVGALWALIGGHMRQVAESNRVTTADTSVGFSKTNVDLTLSTLYRSKDGKTIYIPFSFSDLSQVSTNANNYTVAVLDVNGKAMTAPSGKMTIFGTTTGAVIALKSSSVYSTGPVRIIIRNDKNLNDPDDISSNTSTSDGLSKLSKKYDIASFVVNPGAQGMKTSPIVKPAIDPSATYALLFGNKLLKENQKAIDKDDKKLQALYNRESEYRHRLTSVGFKVPDMPDYASKSYIPKSSDTSSVNEVFDDIKNDKGQTTAEVSASQDSSDGDSSASSTSPADDWSQLTQIWGDILDTKIDKYVTLEGQRSQLKTSIESQDSVASTAKSSKFSIAQR